MLNQIVIGSCVVCLLALISVVVLLWRERQARHRFETKIPRYGSFIEKFAATAPKS